MMKLLVLHKALFYVYVSILLYTAINDATVQQLPCDKSRQLFNSSWGIITDSQDSNYTQDSHCEWLIKGKYKCYKIKHSYNSGLKSLFLIMISILFPCLICMMYMWFLLNLLQKLVVCIFKNMLSAQSKDYYITLTFQSMETECSYDYLFVYDGDTVKSPLLGSFSGKTKPQQITSKAGSVSNILSILCFLFKV